MLERWFPWTWENTETEAHLQDHKNPSLAIQKQGTDKQVQTKSQPSQRDTSEKQVPEIGIPTSTSAQLPVDPAKVSSSNLDEMEKQLEFVHEILAEISQTHSPHSRNERELKAINQKDINAVHEKIHGRDAWVTFVTAPYQLRINGSSHSINYKTTTGRLDGIMVSESDKSLTAHIVDSTKVGQITLELPRKIIDSKSNTDEDLPFDVRVVYREFTHKAIFAELYRNGESRILQVDLPHDPVAFIPHDLYIRITGTRTIQAPRP